MFAITHPVAAIARGIENLVLYGHQAESRAIWLACQVASRAASITLFPAALALELACKRLPKLYLAIHDKEKFDSRLDKVLKYALAYLCSPLGLHTPESVAGFFLKSPPESAIRPFGVEHLYGMEVESLCTPQTVEELQLIVKEAKKQKKQVSVLGAGMSQGPQAVPTGPSQVVIDMRHFRDLAITSHGQSISVQAGATWEEVQSKLDKAGKSVLVKQASDIFSIGGSIAINCHGWAHEYGAIASTVESLEIIDLMES